MVYRDHLIDDDFYSIGEGVAGVGIEARSATGDVYGTEAGASGGYRLAVPNGTYTVVSRTGERIFGLGTVTIADKNVKLDLMTDRIPADPVYDLDANRDGSLTLLDVLVVINFLNLNVPDSSLTPESRVAYDINKNASIEPLDVLIVINAINRQSGEGESGVWHNKAASTQQQGTVETDSMLQTDCEPRRIKRCEIRISSLIRG